MPNQNRSFLGDGWKLGAKKCICAPLQRIPACCFWSHACKSNLNHLQQQAGMIFQHGPGLSEVQREARPEPGKTGWVPQGRHINSCLLHWHQLMWLIYISTRICTIRNSRKGNTLCTTALIREHLGTNATEQISDSYLSIESYEFCCLLDTWEEQREWVQSIEQWSDITDVSWLGAVVRSGSHDPNERMAILDRRKCAQTARHTQRKHPWNLSMYSAQLPEKSQHMWL